MNIHQFHQDFAVGDAISNEMLKIRQVLIEKGHNSEIFSCYYNKKKAPYVKAFSGLKSSLSADSILIIHYSINNEVLENLVSFPGKKVLLYHNSTPAHFFDGYSYRHELLLQSADEGLKSFKGKVDAVWADSEYNAQKLVGLSFENIKILPILIDTSENNSSPDQSVIDKYNDDFTNILFVGRVAPNKKQEDLIKAFYYFTKRCNPKSRLIIVGSYVDMEVYYDKLKVLVNELGMANVIFTGHVTDAQLLAYYETADLFLSMSEHEGFGVPLLEAMQQGVPVMAYASSAVKETLGSAGILFEEKNYLKLVSQMALVFVDQIRKDIIEKQKERLADFAFEKTSRKLIDYIELIKKKQICE